jgi:Bacterial inner membrane protein
LRDSRGAMSHWVEGLGWTATGVFVGSYFFTRATALRGVQMLGALLWATYGLLIKAPPVIVANVLVFAAAAWTLLRAHRPPSS